MTMLKCFKVAGSNSLWLLISKTFFFFKSWLILFLDALGIDAKVLRKFRGVVGGVTICVVNDIGWCAFTHKLGYFLVGLI